MRGPQEVRRGDRGNECFLLDVALSLGAGERLRWMLGCLLWRKRCPRILEGCRDGPQAEAGEVGGGRPGIAGTVQPACSIWKADLLGHGRHDSNGGKKNLPYLDKEPGEAQTRSQPRPPPPPPASCSVSHWAPGPEPCPRGLALRLQAALWHPPLSYQASFPVARPGPWVLGSTQCWAELRVEMQREVLAEPGWRGCALKPAIPTLRGKLTGDPHPYASQHGQSPRYTTHRRVHIHSFSIPTDLYP